MATIDDNTRLIPHTEKAVEFLLKYGNQKFCLSAIDPDGAIETVTFGRGQEKEMGSWIDKYQAKRNLYYHINSVKGWPNNKKKIAGLLNEWPETGDNPEEVAIEPWRLHDLRRTAASRMARPRHPSARDRGCAEPSLGSGERGRSHLQPPPLLARETSRPQGVGRTHHRLAIQCPRRTGVTMTKSRQQKDGVAAAFVSLDEAVEVVTCEVLSPLIAEQRLKDLLEQGHLASKAEDIVVWRYRSSEPDGGGRWYCDLEPDGGARWYCDLEKRHLGADWVRPQGMENADVRWAESSFTSSPDLSSDGMKLEGIFMIPPSFWSDRYEVRGNVYRWLNLSNSFRSHTSIAISLITQ